MREEFIGFKLVFDFPSVLLLLFFYFSTPYITVFVSNEYKFVLY